MGLFGTLLTRVFSGDVENTGRNIDERSDATRKLGVGDPQEQEKTVKQDLIPVVSSWVAGMRWVGYGGRASVGDLIVKFRSGVVVKYQGIPHDLYDDFFAASSKGRFVHRYLKGRPYSIVSKP